jgi:CubicO group peptidase (beta-lactamase class C family)
MRALPVLAGCLAAALAGPSQAESLPTPAPLTGPDVAAWLEGFLPYALQSSDVAGAVVVVVKDGEVLIQKGYGYADVAQQTPVDAERTLFRIGSVAKLFTWTAVMQLVESGRLDLDRDVNEYLDFTIPARAGKPVTLRNLMTHTPGFEEVLKNLISDDPGRLLPLDQYLKTWTPERIYPPGEVPAYSNYGAALAGYIVQRVSSEPYDDYLDRHVFEPLGMANTTTRQPLPARFAPRMSKGYLLGSGPSQPYELVGPSPAGGAAATGADMARFMIAYLKDGQLGSGRILAPQTVRLMHSTRLPIVPPLNSMLLGFFQQDLHGRRIPGHDGDTQFFHSTLNLLVDEGVGVFLSMNSTGKGYAPIAIRSALMNEFVDRYFPAPADDRTVDPETAADHARLMAGIYKTSRRAQSSFLSLAFQLSQVRVAVGQDGQLAIPALTGLNGQPMAWREVEPFVWHEVGGKERLAAKVEDGEVVMFGVDSSSPFEMFQPVPWWQSWAWLMPLVSIALAAVLLTVAAWPIGAALRRRYGVTPSRSGSAAKVYRLLRFANIAIIAVLAGWAGIVSLVSTNIFAFSPRLDPWILILRLATLVVLPGAAAIAIWNARCAWSERRGWDSRLWSVMLVFSCAVLLWVAIAFNLIGFSVDY